MRAYSIQNLSTMKFDNIPFRENWSNVFGSPQNDGIWMLSGKDKYDNSRFAASLAKELDELGYRVLYLSLRGMRKDFCEMVYQQGWRMHLHRIISSSTLTARELSEYLSKHKSPDIVIIDSIYYWTDFEQMTAMELLDLYKNNPKKLFIYVSEVMNGQIIGEIPSGMYRYSALSVDIDDVYTKLIKP